MITAGEILGKARFPQLGQRMARSGPKGSMAWPQHPQKRLVRYQLNRCRPVMPAKLIHCGQASRKRETLTHSYPATSGAPPAKAPSPHHR